MRMWSKREDEADEIIPAPADIRPILEYSMEGAEVPEGVTIPGRENISSGGVAFGFSTAGDGEAYVRRADGTWEVL